MSDQRRVAVLIVDDEPVARAGMRHMLADVEWIECIGEAASGPAAVEAIDALRPELVFLDIQMPGISGIEVLRQIAHQPFVVFTTAFAEHAVEAFELGAVDYLLKPFGAERLRASLDRARAALGEPLPATLDRLGELLGQSNMTRLFVRTGRSIVPVAVADIAWFEAVGDYVNVHARDAQHLVHLSLNRIEARLDAQRFSRIHRTYIVNLDHVTAFQRQPGARLIARLDDGTSLPVSRAKAHELRNIAR
jgi:two-component system, LytTR family, response regulator